MSSYNYRCVDESILLPFLKKNVFSILHRYIPYGIPANYLTLVSIFVIWSCFIHLIRIDKVDVNNIIISFFAIIIYVIFDHFDGLQAKLTKTGTPLGEILDHYSDVFNGSIIIYICFRILEIELDWIFYLVIWTNLIAFSVTYLEQSILKVLYFGKVGSLEGVVIILLILCSYMTSSGKTFWLKFTIIDLPVYIFLVWGLIMGVIYTVLGSLKRIKYIPKSFIHFVLLGSILCYCCIHFQISWYFSFLLINAYSGNFILKSMKSHLVSPEDPKPDKVVYFLFFFILIASIYENEERIYFFSYGLFITTITFWNLNKILYQLRKHWIWWNFS